jgi:hypothetical protein
VKTRHSLGSDSGELLRPLLEDFSRITGKQEGTELLLVCRPSTKETIKAVCRECNGDFSPTILIEIPPTPQLSLTCLFHMLLCKRSGNKLSHSCLSAQKPALVARLKPCPFTRVAQPKPYATPSTIESPAAVGMIRESFHPDASNNLRNSGSVRSRPLGKISICKSRNFPGEKSLPG